MFKRSSPRVGQVFAVVLAAISINLTGIDSAAAADGIDTVVLLLPDTASPCGTNPGATDPAAIAVWLDAAAEEGLHLRTMTDSQFMALGTAAAQYKGVIMPDQVHCNASDALVSALQGYVAQGGNL